MAPKWLRNGSEMVQKWLSIKAIVENRAIYGLPLMAHKWLQKPLMALKWLFLEPLL